jgi:alpha-tubulin suppressor-like RCC1 family protein
MNRTSNSAFAKASAGRQNLLRAATLVGVLTLNGQAQTTVTQIAVGVRHSLFLKSDGSLWGMGLNANGELGDGTTNNSYAPELIESNAVTAIAANGGSSFFIKSGDLWAMGANNFGQLGDGTPTDHLVPVEITNEVRAIFAGEEHSLFIRRPIPTLVQLWGMGENAYGELGIDAGINELSPVDIESANSTFNPIVTAAAMGVFHSLFIKSNGSLWVMGNNSEGQLGDGTTVNEPVPEMIPRPLPVTAIAAGEFRSFFLQSDGSLWAMGDNDFGALGDGTTTSHLAPEEIEPGVTAIAAASESSFYLTANGSLFGWGENDVGQLGIGTETDSHAPAKIVAAGVTAVAPGELFTLFLLSDGSLWGMGNNNTGQLGTPPTPTNHDLPVQIVGPMVANGSFETGDLTGWTWGQPEISGINFIGTDPAVVHSGKYGAALQGPSEFQQIVSLSQTLTTAPGTNYSLSFWLNSADGLGDNELQATWGGNVLPGLGNLVAGVWTHFQFDVTATDTNTALQFNVGLDPSRLGLDDVSVVPEAQPGITSLSLAGTNIVLNATNGQWSGTYCLLTSTSMTQPLSQWTPVATNTLDGSGNFTITATNAVNTNAPQQFYTLQLQ